jgi:hypothetical protein
MKKLSLIVTLLLAVLLLQNCKKDSYSESAQSNTLLFAVINDTTWNAQTVTASITYNSASNTKVLNCQATGSDKQLVMKLTQTTGAVNSAGFPLTAFNADGVNNTFAYETMQNNTYTPLGTVSAGSGTFTVSAIDSVKKTMTGTFSFTAQKNNYDNNGNVTSVTVNQVLSGAFNNLPYTFNSN